MSKLGDHIEYVKGFAFKSKDYTETGIPVIRVSNFTDNSIDIKDVYHIPKERFSEFQKVNLIKDDIVIATVGSWPTNPSSVVGKTIRVPPEANNTLLNQNAVRIRSLDKDEQLYFYYVLKDKSFSDYIISTAQGSANQASITLKSILDYDLPNIDSKEKRIKIGKTLATYDEKIQLNTQINQTLEQIAQALFKSWFIDFDPVRAKVQALSDGLSLEQAELAAMQAISGKTPEELTALSQAEPECYAELAETTKAFPCEIVEVDGVEVPKGWEVKALSDLGQIICGKTPSKSNKEFYGNDVPFIKIPDMHNQVFITQTTDNLSVAGANSQSKKYIPPKSICVSCIATVGLVSMTSKRSHTNQQINSIIPNNEQTSEFLYLSLKQPSMTKHLKDLASGGSATLNLNTSTFSKIEIITPSKEIIDIFYKKVCYFFEKILSNSIENKRLSKTRDLLLPRLLNGEI
jgi:putative type-1 restriction enzyme hindVIIP specificity protein